MIWPLEVFLTSVEQTVDYILMQLSHYNLQLNLTF